MIWVGVALASGLGAVSRYGVTAGWERWRDHQVPWGTAAVNIGGAFLLGLLIGSDPGADTIQLLGVGFLGSFTTFSTWMVETVFLATSGRLRDMVNAAMWVLGMTALGVAAFGIGQAL